MPRMNFPIRTVTAAIVAAVLIAPVADARKSKSVVQQAVGAYQSTNSTTIPAAGTIEVAFSPNEGSEHLGRQGDRQREVRAGFALVQLHKRASR